MKGIKRIRESEYFVGPTLAKKKKCPYCGTSDTEQGEDIEEDVGAFYTSVLCLTCDKEWDETWTVKFLSSSRFERTFADNIDLIVVED